MQLGLHRKSVPKPLHIRAQDNYFFRWITQITMPFNSFWKSSHTHLLPENQLTLSAINSQSYTYRNPIPYWTGGWENSGWSTNCLLLWLSAADSVMSSKTKATFLQLHRPYNCALALARHCPTLPGMRDHPSIFLPCRIQVLLCE